MKYAVPEVDLASLFVMHSKYCMHLTARQAAESHDRYRSHHSHRGWPHHVAAPQTHSAFPVVATDVW